MVKITFSRSPFLKKNKLCFPYQLLWADAKLISDRCQKHFPANWCANLCITVKESRNIKAAAIHPTVRPPTDCQLLKAAHFCHPDKNLSLRLNSVRNKTDDYLQAGHPFTNHSFKSSNLPEGAAETPPTWPQTCSLTSLEISPPGNLSHPKVKQLLVFIFKLVSVASVFCFLFLFF